MVSGAVKNSMVQRENSKSLGGELNNSYIPKNVNVETIERFVWRLKCTPK